MSRSRLGILVSSLGSDEMAHSILTNDWEGIESIVFFQNAVKPALTPSFAMMNITEAFSYNGVCLATDFDTAEKLLRFPGPSRKFFYVWNLDWFKDEAGNLSYGNLARVYRGLPLIARNESDRTTLESSWNVQVFDVIEGFNFLSGGKIFGKA